MTYINIQKGAFYTGLKATVIEVKQGIRVSQTVSQQLQRSRNKIYRRDILKPLDRHLDLQNYPFRELFIQAKVDYLQSYVEIRFQTEISSYNKRVRGHQVLNYRQVYIYKFNKYRRFVKAKARLVVKGNQQLRGAAKNNYTATLTGQSFRTVIAIAIYFNLELLQFNTVNAFVNADLDKEVYIYMPLGHRRFRTILQLNKALYSLCQSLLLQQQTLSRALGKLSFQAVLYKPCTFTRNSIIIFFYINNIVIAFRKAQQQKALRTIIQLRSQYKLTSSKPLKWFLGIEVIYNCTRGLLQLLQKSYINKIAILAQSRLLATASPIAREELLPFKGTATY